MALVSMKKLTLVGLQEDKDALFDALIDTQQVQLKPVEDIDACTAVEDSQAIEDYLAKSSAVDDAIELIDTAVNIYNSDNKHVPNFQPIVVPKTTMARPLVEMQYSELMDTKNVLKGIMSDIDTVNGYYGEIVSDKARITQIDAEIERLHIYRNLPQPISTYTDTDSTHVMLGTLPNTAMTSLEPLFDDVLAEYSVMGSHGTDTLLLVIVHKEEQELLSHIMALGFAKCTMQLDVVTKVHMRDLLMQKKSCRKDINSNYKKIALYAPNVPSLRTAYDYINILIEKQLVDNTIPKTGKTFVLEGYVPAKQVDRVLSAIAKVSNSTAVFVDEIAQDEYAPTMYSNNGVVSSFESVTNMYTPPQYHEIDPNPMMSFFYFVIFGMMVADMGYGLVLALVGLFAKLYIKQNTGTKQLLSLFGLCGISAIGIGALYGSFFSYPLLSLFGMTPILPDPSIEPKVTMVIALMFGVVHIIAGNVLAFVNHLRNREYVTAYGVSLMWVVFFSSALVALFEMGLSFMDYPPFVVDVPEVVVNTALYVLLGSLAVIMICAGGSGKKSIMSRLGSAFGSVYGLINLFGDIMSYIRIFGLMLSSAMMGVVINDLSASVASGGLFGVVMSVVLLIFAHLFNLVIGILGVYIHNGRLQYVEFFGKFYQGDGTMFVPFGSNIKYTLLKQQF